MNELAGRVAIVTGASKGIGRAIAERLVEDGVMVTVSSRSREDVDRVAAELTEQGPGDAMGWVCDVGDPAACEAMIEATVDRFGGLDILVNNAGLGILKPIQELSVEEFQVQIRTNLCGVFYCTKFAAPHLSGGNGGWVINIGSLAGRNAFASGSGYNASKFGLRGLSEASMLDLRYDNIRVSMLMPGSVNTEFAGNQIIDEGAWKLETDDIARAVVDLLHYPGNALPSKIEMRPSTPPRR